jgi:hypothetical protein
MTMGIWVVVVVLGMGAGAAAVLSRRRSDDVEPTVREFAEFRDAIGKQVAGAAADAEAARRHLDRTPAANTRNRSGSHDTHG